MKLKHASLLYYQIYEEELPLLDYKEQDIDYIIEQLSHMKHGNKEVFESDIMH